MSSRSVWPFLNWYRLSLSDVITVLLQYDYDGMPCRSIVCVCSLNVHVDVCGPFRYAFVSMFGQSITCLPFQCMWPLCCALTPYDSEYSCSL